MFRTHYPSTLSPIIRTTTDTYTKTVNAGIQRHPHCVFHHFLIVVKYCQSMCQTLPANTHYFDIYSAKPTMWIIRDLHCNGQFQAHSVWFQCIATLGNCSRTSRHHSVLTNGLDLQNDCLWHHNCRKHSKLYTWLCLDCWLCTLDTRLHATIKREMSCLPFNMSCQQLFRLTITHQCYCLQTGTLNICHYNASYTHEYCVWLSCSMLAILRQ